MKVLFIINIPSPYRLKFFEKLGAQCDLTVLFERASSSERDGSWKDVAFKGFRGIILKSIRVGVDMALAPSVKKYLKDKYDFIFVADFLSPTGMLVTRYLKRHKIPYVLESDGGFVGTDSGIKKKIKTMAMSGAAAYFSTGKAHDEYYRRYGADAAKIVRYPFSSVTADRVLDAPVSAEEKADIKRRLGITEDRVVLYVGQFIHRKGIDILLRAYARCQNVDGLYLIGGTATDEYLRLMDEYRLKNVHFIGFTAPDEIAAYYKAADVFVLPTRYDIWGLVVNEAMTYGLPVITSNACLAGLEMVESGKTGMIFENENVGALTEAIDSVISDKTSETAVECLRTARRYTIEAMTERHMEYMRECMHD